MKKANHQIRLIALTILFSLFPVSLSSQTLIENPELDIKVKAFLEKHKNHWYYMNVPSIDGQLLFDIITENNYKSALEIGTSTGHSGIWIAWALSKTGGKLITIEIDKKRHNIALKNFEEAGLSDYINARLADAHTLVPKLKGPFDFVFSDADKGWYKNYFISVNPNLKVGGCFTAHNISERQSRYRSGQGEFLNYIKGLSNYETTVNSSGGGVSISYKKAK